MSETIDILYVEDNPADARLMKEYLAESCPQCRLHTAATLGEALDYLAGNPVVDVILCDLTLPDSQGLETFRKIHARSQRIPLVVLSGLADEETALKIVQEGAQDYLVKGRFNQDALGRTIRYALERDRAAKALRESEKRYRSVGELVPFGVWIAGEDGAITYLSDVFLDMVGMSMDQCKGFGWTGRVHPEDAERMASAWKECVRDETPWDYEYRIRDRFGDYRTVLSRGTPVRDHRGRLVSWAGINLDITGRKGYEEALIQSEETYRAMFEDSRAVTLLIDPDSGRIIDGNHAACKFYGYTREKLLDMRMTEINTLPESEIKQELEMARTQKKAYFNFKHRLAGGEIRDVEVYSGTISIRGHVLLYSIIHDVTDRIAAEQAQRQSEEKYRLVVETVNSVITVAQDGLIRYVNDRVTDLLGYSPQEVIGNEVGFFLDDQDRKAAQRWAEGWISGQPAPESITLRMRHKSGELRHVQINGTLMIWEGRPALLSFMTDVTQRKLADALISARATLFQYAVSHSLEEFLQKVLDEIGELTNSPIGFYHFVEKDQQTLSLQAWSTRTVREFCKAEGKGMHYSIDQAGVWVDCVRERHPVIHNDYAALPHKKGLPEGHTAITRELVVPIMRSERIVAILGIGNKPTNYTEKDMETASYVADVAWEITENKRAEEELRRNAGTNAALAELYEPLTSPGAKIQDITQVVLEKALDLTESAHGYVAEIDPYSGESLVHTITNMFQKQRKALGEHQELRFPPGKDGRYGGLWGHALNTREAFFTNSPSSHPAARGVPKGHDPVKRFLSVPVLLGDEMVGQIALANAGRDYSERDKEAIQRLAEFYALAIQRVRAEQTILASLAEKEALLREIHHRVKNNLQTVSSLLSMAQMGTKNKEASDLLRDAESRVHAMALIHSQLYGSRQLDRIDLKRNIRELTDRLSAIYSAPKKDIAHSVDGKDVFLTIHQAIPAALAVNEVVTNAFKYAFEGRQAGTITVQVGRKDDTIEIAVADNGGGMPAGFDVEKTTTLGLRLVKNLIEGQLGGQVDFGSGKGTKVMISFKMDDQEGVRPGQHGR